MKNVLLLVHDDDGQEARVQAALDLTRSLSGHLTCFDAVRLPEYIGDYMTTPGAMIFECDEKDRASRNRDRLEPRLEREGVSWDWVSETGDIAELLSHRVDLSDIIVLNTDLHDHLTLPDMRAITSQIAIKSRKPILAVPEQARGFAASDRAMLCWDGSAPNVAALQAATPILALASAVFIVEADFREADADKQVSAEDAAGYLSRHGIKTTVEHRRTQGLVPIANLLLDAAHDRKIGYAVLGAFGHSRMKEAIFGGVTRAMLTHTRIPIILAH